MLCPPGGWIGRNLPRVLVGCAESLWKFSFLGAWSFFYSKLAKLLPSYGWGWGKQPQIPTFRSQALENPKSVLFPDLMSKGELKSKKTKRNIENYNSPLEPFRGSVLRHFLPVRKQKPFPRRKKNSFKVLQEVINSSRLLIFNFWWLLLPKLMHFASKALRQERWPKRTWQILTKKTNEQKTQETLQFSDSLL